MEIDTPLSFWEFFSESFVPLNLVSLPLKPAHKEICDTLERAVLGELKKQFIIINIPPRIGKTKILEALDCWMLGYFPDSQILATGYSADLVTDSLRYVRQTMNSEWYQAVFPTRLGYLQKADHFVTTQGGAVYGAGVDGTLTGKGAGLKRVAGGYIKVDDPANPNQALSVVESERLRFWIENTLKSRRNSAEFTPIIIVAQRLAVDDLCGYVLAMYPEDVCHIKIPGIKDGVNLFPETYTDRSLDDTKRVNLFTYCAQILQDPTVLGGNIIHVDRFVPYSEDQYSVKWESRIITCDTALEAKQHNDASCLQLWGKLKGHAYLLDQVWGRWESPELLAVAKKFWDKCNQPEFPVRTFYVEKKAAGSGLMQQLRKMGVPTTPVERDKDKVTRVKDIVTYIENGLIHVPKNATWLQAFITECAQFREDGKAPHDDQVDCLCDGITFTLGKVTSIFDVMRSNAA